MKRLEATIEIGASPEQVWQILVDFKRYSEWNPFIISLEGTAKVGEKLREVILQPDGKRVQLTSQIVSLEPAERLVWNGYFGAPFLFSGKHEFILEATPQGTRFTQRESFTGLMLFMLDVDAILPGYHQMNAALKARVEQHSSES